MTDVGQSIFPYPVEGMRAFIDALLAEGVTRREIELMLTENPPRLLGL